MSKTTTESDPLLNGATLNTVDKPLIDPSLNLSNPGSYEDLHKKTKGSFQFF